MPESGLHTRVSKRSGGYDVFITSARGGYLRGDTFRLAAWQDSVSAEGIVAAKTYDTGADKLSGDRLFDRSFRAAESDNRSAYAATGY